MKTRRPAAIYPMAALAALVLLAAAGTGSAQEKTIADLIGIALRGQPTERLEAIRKLGSYTDPQILAKWKLVDVLLDLVDDDDPRAARAAVRGLGSYARGVKKAIADQIIGPLGKIVKDTERHLIVRMTAVIELGRAVDAERFEHQEAAKTLVSIARNAQEDSTMRVAALGALGKIAPTAASVVIRKSLRDRDQDVVEAGFEALKNCLKSPRAELFAKDRALGGLMANELGSPRASALVKKNALEILALIAGLGVSVPSVESSLIKVLENEEDPEFVQAALYAVGLVGSVKSATAMVGTYGRFGAGEAGGAGAVRIQICTTAGTLFAYWGRKKQIIRARSAAATLTELLGKILQEDISSRVKREAAVSLGYLYDKGYDKREAVKILIVVLGHDEMGEGIKSAALDSLEVLTRKSFGHDTKRWEDWYKKNARKLAPIGH